MKKYNHRKHGIKLKITKDVDNQVKLACIEFSKWLRKKYEFPVKLNVYIKSNRFIISKKKEQVSATIFCPFNKTHEPYIKVSTGDYEEMKLRNGIYSAIMAILCSFAHEIVHYFQWIEDRQFKEKEAKVKSVEIVEEFSESKEGLLTCNENVFKLIKKADSLCNEKEYKKAIEYYDKIIELNPGIYSVCYSKGIILDSMEIFEEAVKCYDEAIKINPFEDKFYSSKAYSLDCLFKYEEAIVCYDEAIRLNPKEAITYNNKGYALLLLDKYEEAIKCFDKAIELNFNDKGIYVYKAQALESLYRYKEAILCYEKSMELSSGYDIAYNGKGRVLFLLGKYEEVLECYDKAIQIDPKYAEPYYNKAITYLALYRIDDCLINLKKSIQLDAEYINYARDEKYFDIIRDKKAFIDIMGGATF